MLTLEETGLVVFCGAASWRAQNLNERRSAANCGVFEKAALPWSEADDHGLSDTVGWHLRESHSSDANHAISRSTAKSSRNDACALHVYPIIKKLVLSAVYLRSSSLLKTIPNIECQ